MRVLSGIVSLHMLGYSWPVFALPSGESVAVGTVEFSREGNTLNVLQSSGAAVVNYSGFDIGSAEAVIFSQPDASSRILNRVLGGDASVIEGALLANGQVYLINPNGILFTGSARVDVGGLVASALNLSDGDFLSGNLSFSGGGGNVVNQGSLSGRFVYLIGGAVQNDGAISAAEAVLAAGQSSVVIDHVAGGEVRLILDGVEEGAAADGATGGATGDAVAGAGDDGAGAADGAAGDDAAAGTAETAGAADGEVPDATAGAGEAAGLQALLVDSGTVINQGTIDVSGETGGNATMQGWRVGQFGTVSANGTVGSGGTISLHADDTLVLTSDSVTTANAGANGDGGSILLVAENTLRIGAGATIEARGGSESGNGGFVETSGHAGFEIGATPDITAPAGQGGTWLIDPYNIEIVAGSGWGTQLNHDDPTVWFSTGGDATIGADEVVTVLDGGGSLVIQTAGGGGEPGNISVNAPIVSGGAAVLSLEAVGSIALNASISLVNGSLRLTATSGNINQTAGSIQTGNLRFEAGASVNLNAALNDFSSVSGSAGGNVTIVDATGLTLNDVNVGANTLNVTTGGALADANPTFAGALVFSSSGPVTLTDIANDFGTVSGTAAGTVTLSDDDDIALGTITVNGGGDLNVDAGGAVTFSGVATVTGLLDVDTHANGGTGGNITDSAGGRLLITGKTALDAGDQGIVLDNAANDFGGAVLVAQADGGVAIDDDNDLTLGPVNTLGALNVDAGGAVTFDGIATVGGLLDVDTRANGGTGGAITDTGAGQVLITGTTALDAGDQGIVLDNALNDFGGAVSVSRADLGVDLDDADDITLGTVTTLGTLNVDAGGAVRFDGVATVGKLGVNSHANGGTGGVIEDTGAGRLLVATTTTLDAGDQGVALDNAANDFGGAVSVAQADGGVTIDDDDDLTLDVVNTAGDLNVDAGGAVRFAAAAAVGGSLVVKSDANGGTGATIEDTTGQLIVTGQTSLDAGSQSVLLDNAANNFVGAVSVVQADGGVTLADSGNLLVGSIASAGDVTLTPVGAVLDADTSDDSVANVTAANLILSAGAGVGAAGAGGDLDLDVNTVRGSANGSIVLSNDGNLTIGAGGAGLSTAAASGGSIAVTVAGGLTVSEALHADGLGAVNLETTGAGGDKDIVLNAQVSSAGGNIAITAADDVDQQANIVTGGGSVNVHGGNVAAGGAWGGVRMGAATTTSSGGGPIGYTSGNGGEVSLALLNAAGGNVTVTAAGSLLDANGAANNVVANTLTAGAGNALATSGNRLEVDVNSVSASATGGGLYIDSSRAGLVTVTGLTTDGGDIRFEHTAATVLFVTGPVASGDAGTHGGDIDIISAGNLLVLGTVSSESGGGGSLTISGASVFTTPTAGKGDILLQGSSPDVIIAFNIVQNTTVNISATRDIDIQALVQTTDPLANIVLAADSNGDGSGGVRIGAAGALDSAGSIAITGSDLFLSGTPPFDSVWVQSDGANVQVQAAGDVTIQSGVNAPAGADVFVEGGVVSSAGSVNITALDTVYLALDGKVTAANDVTVSGADADVQANVTAGGAVTFSETLGAGIDIGAIAAVGGYDVDNAEIARVSAAALGASTAGALSIDGVNVAGTDLNLAGGTIAQGAGAVAADALTFAGAGAVTLGNTANDFASAAGSAAGPVVLGDVDDLDLAGINAGANALTILAGGPLTDSAGNTAGALGFMVAGAVTLDDAANDFDSVAALTLGPVTLRDVDGLDLAGVNVGANQLSLTTGGALTDSAGNIAGTLVLNAGGAVTLDHAANDFNSVAGTAGGNVTIGDADDLDLAGVNAGANGLNVTTGTALTDSAGNTAGALVFAAGGAVTLDHAANDFGSAAGTAGGAVTLHDANDLDLAGVNAGIDQLSLTTGGELTDSAANTAGALVFNAGGAVTLNHAGNDFNTAAGTAGGNVTIRDADELDLAGVDAGANALSLTTGAGLTDSAANTAGALVFDAGGAVALNHLANDFDSVAGTAAGIIMVYDADDLDLAGVNAGANLIGVLTGGALTDSAGNTALALLFDAGGAVTVDHAANDFDSVAGVAGGNVTIRDVDGLNLAGVNAGANDLALTTGGALTDSAANTADALVLNIGGTVTLSAPGNDFNSVSGTAGGAVAITDVDDLDLAGIDAGANTLALTTGGALTDSAANTAGALVLAAGGAVTLDDPGNDFNTAAGTAGGNIAIADTDDLDLAGVNAGANSLSLTTGGALTDSAANTAGALVLDTGGAVTLDEAANDFNSVAGTAGGNVTISDADELDLAGVDAGANGLNVTTGTALTDSAANTAGALVFAAGGAVTLDHAANDFGSAAGTAGGNIAIRDVDNLDLAGINAGANSLSLTTGGALTDSAANTAGALVLAAGGAVTLDHAGNDFNTAAGTAGGNVTIRDVDELDLAGVNAGANQISLTTGGVLTDSAGNTAGALVFAAGGAVTLDHAANDFNSAAGTAGGNIAIRDIDDLDLAGVNAGANQLSLTTGGALTDSAANTAGALVLNAGGTVTLDDPGNDFNTVAGTGGGDIAIVDIDELELAGVNAAGQQLSVTTGGVLTDSAANMAGALVFDTGGAVTLDHPANDFDSAAGTAGGNVTLVDVDGLDLAGVDAGANQLSVKTGGLLTDSAGNTAGALVLDVVAGANLDDVANDFDTLAGVGGNIHVTDADDLDLAGVNVGVNQLSLTTGGTLTDSAASIAKALVFDAGGAVTLDEAANDFDTAAGVAGGDVTLRDVDDLDLAGVDAGVNELNVTTGGALTDSAGNTAGALVFSAGGAVTLDDPANDFNSAAGTAAGPIVLADVDDLDLAGIQAPAQTLDVKTGGALTDSAASDVAAFVFASGGNVTLDDPGNTFNTLAGRSGGNVLIVQNGDLVVGTVKGVDGVATTAGSDGDIDIQTAGLLTVSKAVSADGSGNVVLRSGADRDLLINAQVDSGSGDISLIADDDVIVTASVKTGGGGDIAVWADADDDPDAAGDDDGGGDVLHTAGTIETGSGDVYFYGEDIFQNPGAIHRTASGTLVYRADQTLNLNGVVNAGGGSIVAEAASIALNTLTAGNTIVLRASAGSIGGGTISARNVGLSANQNIGSSGNRAVVTANTLATDTDAGNNGDVYLTINGSAAAGTVTPPSVDPPAGEADGIPLPDVPTLTGIRSDDLLSMNGPGNVGGGEVSSGGDAVIGLGSMQGLNSLVVGNDLDLTAGAVDITTIDVSGSADLSVSSLGFDTFTVGGEAQIESAGVEGGSLVVGGNLNLDANGDVGIAEIDVGGDATLNTGDLSFDTLTADSVEADTGSIDMGRLTAGTATIRAGGNVTDNGSLINVSTLTLVASGDIGAAGAHIDVNVPNLVQVSGNNVYVTQLHAGDTRLGLLSAQGYLELFAPNASVGGARGGLVDANGDALNLAAGNGAFLNIRGYIGQPGDPLEANINGILRVDSYDLTGDETGASFIYVIYTQDAEVSGVKYIGDDAIPGLIIVNGQVLGGDENLMRRIFRTEAFTVETPELKSRQGIFGNPFFIHEYMDISEFSALGLIDFLLAGQATISGDPELPDEVYSEMIFGGVHPSTAVRFTLPADEKVAPPEPSADDAARQP